jgi:transposase-like protein
MGETEDRQEDVQPWTAKGRAALVLEILKGKTTIAEAVRSHGLTVVEVERWKERFLAGAENALRSRPRDEEEQKDELIKHLERKVGAWPWRSTSCRRR